MRRLVLAVAVLLAVLMPGAPAWAHTSLVSSDPARDATMSTPPATVTLVFTQRLNPDFTTIVLSDAAARRIPASPPAIDDARGTITVDRPLGNGVYTVAYRVVSLDGHTVQGSYTFTVADPSLSTSPTGQAPAGTAGQASGAAGASGAAAASGAVGASGAGAAPSAGSGGISPPLLIGLAAAAVLLVALALYFVLSGRRKRS